MGAAMATGRFFVVLTGELDSGRDPAAVRAALRELFQLDDAEAARLLESAPVTVKSNLDYDTAAKYKAAIEQTGARCELREERSGAHGTDAGGAEAPSPAGAATPAPPAPAPAPAPAGAAWREAPGAAAAPRAPRAVAPGRGMEWWGEAWRLFRAAPVTWIVMAVIALALFVLTALVPLVNMVAPILLPPLLMGGVMAAAEVQQRGGEARIGQLFEGFSSRTGPLLAVGGLYFAGLLVVSMIAGVLMMFLGLGGALMGHAGMEPGMQGPMGPAAMLFASGAGLLTLLVMAALFLPLYAALWFAPPLVMLRGMSATDAMKQSLVGCLRSWVAMLIYSVVMLVLATLAVFTLGLAWLVLGPVLMLTVYVAYRDIFVD